MTSAPPPGALVSRLRQTVLDAVRPLLPPSGRYALVDFPRYANAGDSAIWLGTGACFDSLRAPPPVYVASEKTFSPSHLRALLGDGTIFIQGGGSFGDLWPARQAFREVVIQAFPDHPIVQLPQTLHFQRTDSLAKTREVVRAHPAFTLLVRDAQSLEIARNGLGVRTALVPDMALALGELPRGASPRADIVWIKRDDQESTCTLGGGDLPPGVRQYDWPEDRHTLRWRRMKRRSRRIHHADGVTPRQVDALRRSFDAVGLQRLRAATALLDEGRVVITDRLHAHIFCLLRRQPHVLLDNGHGKLGTFAEAWTRDASTVRRASTPARALQAARALEAAEALLEDATRDAPEARAGRPF